MRQRIPFGIELLITQKTMEISTPFPPSRFSGTRLVPIFWIGTAFSYIKRRGRKGG
jgi:hypothetical protein